MANIRTWPGSSSFFPGDTPFGFYDNDQQFSQDADKVSTFCARRLGYPLVEVELQNLSFYAAFEEAVTTYGNEVYGFKVRQDYLSLEGATTGSELNHALITPNMGVIVRLSEQYGEEAGTGGNVTWHSGSLALTGSQQTYNLDTWATDQGITSGDLEVKTIFFEPPPAIVKYFDPYAGTGTGMMNMMDSFGWGNYSPAINFMLMPINFDLAKLQAIELNDTVRQSNFSFQLINNILKVFPVPTGPAPNAGKLWINYILKTEREAASMDIKATSKITNVSNVPYTNPTYRQINSVGRSWIFEYTLALSKEILGYIRGKYATVPIPGADVTLNQSDLLSSATADKTALITRLREYLDQTSREKLLERRALETDHRMKELNAVPYPIYIG